MSQHCYSLPNGKDLYLDISTGVEQCRPCTKKCYWTQDNSLPKSCRDLHAQDYCKDWPRTQVQTPLNTDATPLNISNISSWGIALAILGVMLFILGIVFTTLYLNKDHPRLKRIRTRFRKRFRLLLQHIGIVSHDSYPTEESNLGDAAVAMSIQEQMVQLVINSQEPTNESGAYSIVINFIIIMLAILTLTYCYTSAGPADAQIQIPSTALMLPPKAPGNTASNLKESQIPKPGQSGLTSVEVHPVSLLTETTTPRSQIQSPALSVVGQLEASSSSREHCELDLGPEHAVGSDALHTKEPLKARMCQAPAGQSEMSSTSPPPVINPELDPLQPNAAEHHMALDHIDQPQPQELAEAPASSPAPGPPGAHNVSVTLGQVAHEIPTDNGNLTLPDHLFQANDDQGLKVSFSTSFIKNHSTH